MIALVVTIAAVSALHYATDPSRVILHAAYQRFYYVPIILAAYWYGTAGGLLAAVLSAVAYAPHIHGVWAHNPPYTVSQYAEIVVFLLLGGSVGLISSYQCRLTRRYRDAAASLAEANEELRASQEHLRRAERLSALGEIAAGLAHEIRNPLAGVKGAIEIIASRATPGTPEAEFAAIASKEIGRLDTLVSEFLAYARPRPPELRETQLDALVSHVAALLRPEAERAGVTVDVERRSDLPAVRVDPEQLEQVIFNVTLNAIQASLPGGRVTIQERREGDEAVVEIADHGPGIAAEHLDRVFEPFFTTKERGTGLGLAISQRIVAAHHGALEVRAARPSGTIVRIRLPLPVRPEVTLP